MHAVRHIAIDLMRALGVLALIFLSFSQFHVEAASAHDVLTVAVDQSFCGAAPDADRGHAPCHACRFDPLSLPPAWGGVIRAPQVEAVAFADTTSSCLFRAPPDLPAARGPPRLA